MRDVSFSIQKEEFVILTGPSGCGKTTLCRCLNGLIPHFYGGNLEGELKVAGLDVTKHPIHELAQRVGFVFQNPENQLFALSVEKDVAFGLENLGIAKEEMKKRVDWALRITGIEDLRDRAPHELSGGQQQRVALAGVLTMQPQILVLDEPTSFLDPFTAENIFDVIHELNRSMGITVILVEHRMDLASKYADHVIVMDKGTIVLDGTPKEIFTSKEADSLGIGVPKTVRLYQVLKEAGFSLKDVPITSEETSHLIREAFNND